MAGLTPREIFGRLVRRLGALPPVVILAAAWLVLVIYAFPGQMTQDSFDHLREARLGVYTDGHPPAINLLWKVVDAFIAGPFGMLVIQSVCFLAGLYLVMRRAFEPRPAAWASAIIFVFPAVMLPFAVIWKDCLMAGFLVLGLGGLLSTNRKLRVVGLLGMFAATAVRYNAFAASFPLVLILFEWKPGLHWLKRYGIAFTAWFAVTLAAFGINKALTDKDMYIWHSSLAVYDIVGTLCFIDEDIPDDKMREILAGTEVLTKHHIHETMCDLYTPRDFLPIIQDEKRAMWFLPINGFDPAPKPQRDALERAWKDVVLGHPFAYVKHRFAVMAEVLSIGESRVAGVVTKREFRYTEYAQKEFGLSTHWSPLQNKLTKWMLWVWRHIPIFAPWMYLLLSFVLLAFTRKHRDVFALLTSGILFEGTLVFLAPSPDYRYSHWMVITSILAVVMLTKRRAHRLAPETP